MEIIAYEMKYTKAEIEKSNILCIPFEQKYFQEYMQIYNACFWEMRKFLDIRPYNFLNDYSQILIVNEKFQPMVRKAAFIMGNESYSSK